MQDLPNMLQPVWALPLLGITGLRARDIIGYTAVVFLAMLVAVPTLLWIFG
jgi:short-chain fatty acids transporter